MSELKRCPFCGGGAQVNTWTMHGITESRCFCSNSDCPNSVRTVALEQWNTRPIEDALNKRIAELEAERDQAKAIVSRLRDFLFDYTQFHISTNPEERWWALVDKFDELVKEREE